jgi:hypothetical protein
MEGNNNQWSLNTICEQIMHTKNDLKGQAWPQTKDVPINVIWQFQVSYHIGPMYWNQNLYGTISHGIEKLL